MSTHDPGIRFKYMQLAPVYDLSAVNQSHFRHFQFLVQRDSRVLLFSGQAATADLLATVRGRGHDFNVLPKPVHPNNLLARLEMDTGDSGRDNS
jgi:hypothetical protein